MNYLEQVKKKIGKFPIGCWVPYYQSDLNMDYLKGIRDCNITFLPTITSNNEELDMINKAGLKALVNDNRIVYANITDSNKIEGYSAEYLDHPSYFMSFIWDEPNPTMMNICGAINKILQKDERALGYINLHPNYSDKKVQRSGLTYNQYLNYFIKTCEPRVLSFDNYPFYQTKNKLTKFIDNLAIISKVSKKHNIPFVGFVQSGAFFKNEDVNEEKMRLLVHLLLTFGAKGYLYFTYHKVSHEDGFKDALTDEKGNKTPRYYYAKRINDEVQKYSDVLLNLDIVGIKGTGEYSKYTSFSEKIPLGLDEGIIGIFNYQGKKIYMAVNPNLSKKQILRYNNSEIALEKGNMCLIKDNEIHTL